MNKFSGWSNHPNQEIRVPLPVVLILLYVVGDIAHCAADVECRVTNILRAEKDIMGWHKEDEDK